MYNTNPRRSSSTVVVILAVVIFGGIIAWSLNLFCPLTGPNCTTPPPPPPPVPTVVITIYASDTREDWLNAVVADFNAKQIKIASGEAIFVYHTPVNSGRSKDDILNGAITPTVWSPGDQSWVAQLNQEWKNLHGVPIITQSCQATVYAPVGFAMWRPMAEALGWPNKSIGWDDLLALANDPQGWGKYGNAQWGQFKFGHTHPDISNSGLLILGALAYSQLDLTSGLTPELVKSQNVVDAMRAIELQTYHYGRRSRDNVQRMIERGPAFLHATNTSETEVLRANAGEYGPPQFPLAFIFPADGTFWTEQPYCILDAEWVSDGQKQAAQIFEDYLHEHAQQVLAMQYRLRPVDSTIVLGDPFTLANGTDPNVSPETIPVLESLSPEAAGAVKDVFKQTRKKITLVLVIDTSGSMLGEPITQASLAASKMVLAEALRPDDVIIAYTFNSVVTEVQADNRDELSRKLGTLVAEGGTALYDAVCQAVDRVKTLQAADEAAGERHLYGVVVLSDGQDTSSQQCTQNDMFNELPSGETAGSVRVFTIAYGSDADKDLLISLANRANGKAYTATPEDIEEILLEILFQ